MNAVEKALNKLLRKPGELANTIVELDNEYLEGLILEYCQDLDRKIIDVVRAYDEETSIRN